MKKSIAFVIGILFFGISALVAYLLMGGKLNWGSNDNENCIASGKWQLSAARLDSFLYITKPNEMVPPKLLSSLNITDSLIGNKKVLLELNIEHRGFGMYGDAVITYENTPYTIHYSASAGGNRHSKSCKDFIKLNFGKWHKNGQEMWDTTQYLNNITIKNKYSDNYCTLYRLKNDSLSAIIEYNSYDKDSTYFKFVDLIWAKKYKGGNKELTLIWTKIK